LFDILNIFQRHLLKNIRRKNAEHSSLNNEKSRLGLELGRAKQDIASIMNEVNLPSVFCEE